VLSVDAPSAVTGAIVALASLIARMECLAGTKEGLMAERGPTASLRNIPRKFSSRLCRVAGAVAFGGWILIAALPGRAEDPSSRNSENLPTKTSDEGFFSRWLNMVSRTQAEQPHWMTPLASNNTILTQSFHYDVLSQRLPNGTHLNNYGGGKGLEVILAPNIEVILAVPPWEQHTGTTLTNGVGDWPILMKYRFWSANEEHGNYAVTGFLQYIAATGSPGFGAGTDVLHPGLLFGKGWGPFDVQMEVSADFPLSGNQAAQNFGKPIFVNMVAQYQIWQYLWPEFELNFTWWPDGLRQGYTQLFLTPGILFGPFPLNDRFKFVVGGGYQFAVTQNPVNNGSLIFSVRLFF
jgi:hypothetical protein